MNFTLFLLLSFAFTVVSLAKRDPKVHNNNNYYLTELLLLLLLLIYYSVFQRQHQRRANKSQLGRLHSRKIAITVCINKCTSVGT